MRAPDFWYPDPAWPLPLLSRIAGEALRPLGTLYGLLGSLRTRLTKPASAGIPVLCVGNLTLGGTGKTPVAITIARRLRSRGIEAHLVTRGYGGRLAGPLQVKALEHSSQDIGDEALLLAAAGPTWVARRRLQGLEAAAGAGAEVAVLDDGLQNPTYTKDLTFVVVDGTRGFGNGRVFPAGPLREALRRGLERADAICLMGQVAPAVEALVKGAERPFLRVRLEPLPPLPPRGRYLAFAGIGHPDKFFETARACGLELVGARAFDDHHPYTDDEVAALKTEAEAAGVRLLTTEKDSVRLPTAMRGDVAILPVRAEFEDNAALDALLARLPLLQPPSAAAGGQRLAR